MKTLELSKQQDEYLRFILDEVNGVSEYDYINYVNIIESFLEKTHSLYMSVAFENCIHFGISPMFIYLLEDQVSDVSMLLIYEILHLNKLGLINDDFLEETLKIVITNDLEVSSISKMVAEEIGFEFTYKGNKKNALYKVYEGLYKLNPFPILDSTTSLSKTFSSKKYTPSDLVIGKVNIVHLCSILSVVSKLGDSKSSSVILSTLRRYFIFYNGKLELSQIIMKIPRNRIVNTPRVKTLSKELIVLLDKFLNDSAPVLSEIIKTINLI